MGKARGRMKIFSDSLVPRGASAWSEHVEPPDDPPAACRLDVPPNCPRVQTRVTKEDRQGSMRFHRARAMAVGGLIVRLLRFDTRKNTEGGIPVFGHAPAGCTPKIPHRRRPEPIEHRLKVSAQARPLTNDPAAVDPAVRVAFAFASRGFDGSCSD